MRRLAGLYIGASVENAEEVVDSIEKGMPAAGIYCLCINAGGKTGMLEIMSAAELIKPHNNKRRYALAGIAGGMEEARCLAVEALRDYLGEGGRPEGFRRSLLERIDV